MWKKKHGKITKAKIRIIIEKRRRKEEDENKMNFGRGGDATGPWNTGRGGEFANKCLIKATVYLLILLPNFPRRKIVKIGVNTAE